MESPNCEKNAMMLSRIAGSLAKFVPVSFNVPSPKKRNATPNRKSPITRRFFM